MSSTNNWRQGNPVITKRFEAPSEQTPFARIRGLLLDWKARTKGEIIDLTGGSMRGELGASAVYKQTGAGIFLRTDHSYAQPSGIPEFVDALNSKLERETGIRVNEKDIHITYGATMVLERVIKYSVDERSAVILPEYVYPPIKGMAEEQGGNIFAYRTLESGQPDVEHLGQQLRKAKDAGLDVKFIYVNTPSNPTTVIYTPENQNRIKELAREFEAFIIADDVYFLLVKEENREKTRHISSLLAPEDKDRVPIIQIWSLSKEYQFCGARLGGCYFINCGGIKQMTDLRDKVYKDLTVHLSAVRVFQELGAEILLKTDHIPIVIGKIRERERAVAASFQTEGITLPRESEGTFYSWMKVDPGAMGLKDSADFAARLATEMGVGITPGTAFYCGNGNSETQFFRVALVEPPKVLMEAGNRIREFVGKRM